MPLSGFAIFLIPLFFSLGIGSQLIDGPPVDRPLTIENLSKKWGLEKYKVFYFTEEPSELEQNDYIDLKSDLTFESVSEGVNEAGKWALNAENKGITLTHDSDQGNITFIIEKLRAHKLVLIIDDPNDEDAQYLQIHFTN